MSRTNSVTEPFAQGGSCTSPEGANKVDINKLDLNDPEQRALYKKLRTEVYRPKI